VEGEDEKCEEAERMGELAEGEQTPHTNTIICTIISEQFLTAHQHKIGHSLHSVP